MRRRMMSSAKETYIWQERWSITIALAICRRTDLKIKEQTKTVPTGEIKSLEANVYV